jgi:hypothetical protein
LNEVEKSLSRLGTFDSDIKIEASGTKWFISFDEYKVWDIDISNIYLK